MDDESPWNRRRTLTYIPSTGSNNLSQHRFDRNADNILSHSIDRNIDRSLDTSRLACVNRDINFLTPRTPTLSQVVLYFRINLIGCNDFPRPSDVLSKIYIGKRRKISLQQFSTQRFSRLRSIPASYTLLTRY